MDENPCINTSWDAKKLPGISQGKFINSPLKYSIIERSIIMLIWISPTFNEINFAMMKATHQSKDKNNGSNAAAIGIKNKYKPDFTKNAFAIQYNPRKNQPKENENDR